MAFPRIWKTFVQGVPSSIASRESVHHLELGPLPLLWPSAAGHGKSPESDGKSMWEIDTFWLVVGPPLWKIWTSIGMIIPNIWENKKCSKPPTSIWLQYFMKMSQAIFSLGIMKYMKWCFFWYRNRPWGKLLQDMEKPWKTIFIVASPHPFTCLPENEQQIFTIQILYIFVHIFTPVPFYMQLLQISTIQQWFHWTERISTAVIGVER